MPNEMSRRSMLARTTAGAAASALPIAAIATPVDPIFDVIAEHRNAYDAVLAASGVPDLPDSEFDRIDAKAIDAELPLFTTEPTTIAGVAALLEYVGSVVHPCLGTDHEEGTTILSYASRWDGSPEMLEATRTIPRRMGETLRRLIAAA
jgi:hypothetical protein